MSWAEVFKINSNMTKPLNTLISELISGVTTQITNLANSVTSVNTNVTNTKTQVGTVNTTVNTINTNVANVKTVVDGIKTSVSSLGTQITGVGNSVMDSRLLPMRVITSTTTYTPEKTGLYKIICVGAGGNGGGSVSTNASGAGGGGGGGVAIKTLTLSKNTAYNVTVSTTASFAFDSNTIITATGGGSGSYSSGGSGGTASGGDSNYPGTEGGRTGSSLQVPKPGSVGVAITELTTTPPNYVGTLSSDTSSYVVTCSFGDCLLTYGGAGTGVMFYNSTNDREYYTANGKPAAVIIIPLKTEG